MAPSPLPSPTRGEGELPPRALSGVALARCKRRRGRGDWRREHRTEQLIGRTAVEHQLPASELGAQYELVAVGFEDAGSLQCSELLMDELLGKLLHLRF